MENLELYERIRFRGRPQAHPDAMVVDGNARFTVLTSRMIRLEWSEVGEFEDRCTYAFPTRYSENPPAFSKRLEGNTLVIDTGNLTLRYLRNSGHFTADNLSITVNFDAETCAWTPGMSNPLNLRGTRRTLDHCAGDAALGLGPLSRAGWALFDDSKNVVFEDDGWVGPRPDFALQDWIFFGYGHDYKGALQEYTRFGGDVPLIPRFILGAWWSRYWAYSEQDLRDLVGEFEDHDVPLDVLVIDMDWHTPHAWTGYTWNRELFPDPPAFLKWVHDKGLRATLNLHPAQGVQSFEEIYPAFAKVMGIDPASGEPVPFSIADKDYVQHYFEMLHHPMEDQGVDFWWMDWQQGEISEVKGLDPLLWLNHLHFNDIKRHGVRPMLYSRWGGLGNHRYYIGFSGDTYITWESLQFQPYFTATASNVAYGWWSHDIGGHMGQPADPELFTRWVQFGALSPVLRLHATKDPRHDRRPWIYPDAAFQAIRDAFHLRYQLVPYLYTMARVAADTGISLCRPMYYEYPETADAYVARGQYFLGDQMIAAPIVRLADAETGLSSVDAWIPEGTWIDYQTLETFTGPRWVRLVGDLNRVPMLMRSGAIVPLSQRDGEMPGARLKSGTIDALRKDHLELLVFPGDGQFRLYEDDGITDAYKQGQYQWTSIRTALEDQHTWMVTVEPTEGQCETYPRRRKLNMTLMGTVCPVDVTLNGESVSQWTYDARTLKTSIHISGWDTTLPLVVRATAEDKILALDERHNQDVIITDVKHLLGDGYPIGAEDIDALLEVAPVIKEDAVARLGGPFSHSIEFVTLDDAPQQLGRVIIGAPRDAEPYDVDVTFTCFTSGEPETHHITIRNVTESQILDTPFGFDGEVQTVVWRAEIKLTWRDMTVHKVFNSSPLFPAIYAWHVLTYNPEAPTDSKDYVALTRIMQPDGTVNDELDWQRRMQRVEKVSNLNDAYTLRLWEDYREQLQTGEPLAAFLVTTVVSPTARDVVIDVGGVDPVALYMNGEAVKILPQDVDPDIPAYFRELRRTEVVSLRAGENTLLVSTQPPPGPHSPWFFGAKFSWPEGQPVTDLIFH